MTDREGLSRTWLRLCLLGFLAPLLMNLMIYAGFKNIWSRGLLTEETFRSQYQSSVYKYRVLGPRLLLTTHHLVKNGLLPSFSAKTLNLASSEGDPDFVSAYFYLNTFFICLSASLLFLILSQGLPAATHHFLRTDLPVLFCTLLMCLTQYVLTPYDALTNFFILLFAGAAFSTRFNHPGLLGLLVIPATLSRESAALIPAFYLALHHREILALKNGFKLNPKQKTVAWLTLLFVGVYAGLRCYFGGGESFSQELRLIHNLNPLPVAGFLFLVVLSLIFLLTPGAQPEIRFFLAASLPYVLAIALISNFWETRLWVPLFLCMTLFKLKQLPEIRHENT